MMNQFEVQIPAPGGNLSPQTGIRFMAKMGDGSPYAMALAQAINRASNQPLTPNTLEVIVEDAVSSVQEAMIADGVTSNALPPPDLVITNNGDYVEIGLRIKLGLLVLFVHETDRATLYLQGIPLTEAGKKRKHLKDQLAAFCPQAARDAEEKRRNAPRTEEVGFFEGILAFVRQIWAG